MKELLKQYKLASTGDLNAIKYLIANMGEGKILKTNNYALLQWYIKLGSENDNDAYEKLFSLSNIDDNNGCSYIKPCYIKTEENLILKNRLREKICQVLSDIEEWKKEKAKKEAKRIAKEEARKKKKMEEEAKHKAEEEAKLKAEEEARRKSEEDARRKEEEEKKRIIEAENRRKAEELRKEEMRKLREERIIKRQELWQSIIDGYLNSLDTFQYEEGILFIKKKFIVHYLNKPVTWRVWNAFIHKDSLEDWEDRETNFMSVQQNGKKKNPDDIMVQSKLGTFLKRINEYMAGKKEFDYLYNNKKLEEKILKAKLLKNGVYLYVKEK